MMFDRLLNFLHRWRRNEVISQDGSPGRARIRRKLEERENEARRMNDALEGLVKTMSRDEEEAR